MSNRGSFQATTVDLRKLQAEECLSFAPLIFHNLRHRNYITFKIFHGNKIAKHKHYCVEQSTQVFPELKSKTEDLQEVTEKLPNVKLPMSLRHLSLMATELKHSVTFLHKEVKTLQQVKYFLLEEAAERQTLTASTCSAGDTRPGERLALLYWVKWAPGANCTQQYSTKLQGRGGQSWQSGTDLPLPNSKTAESHVNFACGRSRKCVGRAHQLYILIASLNLQVQLCSSSTSFSSAVFSSSSSLRTLCIYFCSVRVLSSEVDTMKARAENVGWQKNNQQKILSKECDRKQLWCSLTL